MAFRINLRAVVFLVVLMLCNLNTRSQTWEETFKQNKTQKKYLMEQIAALQAFTGYLKKGYTIVSNGIQTIHAVSKTEFSIRGTYLSSLKMASPLIAADPKAREILNMQLAISRLFSNLKDSGFSDSEKTYFSKVKHKVLGDCDADREELMRILGSSIEMTDDQRLSRLETTYQSTRDKLAFSQNFLAHVDLLKSQRKSENHSLTNLNNLYGTQNN
jgi:hypothetical protein